MRRLAGGVFGGFIVLGAAEACARSEAPTGGPPDNFPPYVIETVPDTFAIVEPGLREIRFCFSERISERPRDGRLNDAVIVSPSTGEIRVKHGRECVTVEMEEGLAPDLVYRMTVRPVINDMFGNSLRDAFELVVTTGAEIVPNVVAGIVEDRVTGDATPSARVEARFPHGDDTLTHWNFSDNGGVFSLRYVPAGSCELRAWEDQNRNGEVDESEPQSSFTPCDLPEPPDTALDILTLIQPDTTAPRLTRVEVEDSVTLKIEFDDYIEPTIPPEMIRGTVTVAYWEDSVAVEEEDSVGVGVEEAEVVEDPGDEAEAGDPGAEQEAGEAGEEPAPPPEPGETIGIRIFQEHEYQVWLAAREDSITQAREDSIARAAEAAEAETGDSVAPGEEAGEVPQPVEQAPLPDPAPETGEDVGEDPDSVAGPAIPTTLSGLRLPSRTLVGVLDEALFPDIPYELVVEGLTNIAGAAGGGGVDTLIWEPPPPEEDVVAEGEEGAEARDSVQIDTTEVSDTAQAVDTTTPPPDTTTPPPDTTTPPDTNRVPPDTNRVVRDAPTARPTPPPPATLSVPASTRGTPVAARPPTPFRRRQALARGKSPPGIRTAMHPAWMSCLTR